MRIAHLIPPTPVADMDVADDDPVAQVKADAYAAARTSLRTEFAAALAQAREDGASEDLVAGALDRALDSGRDLAAAVRSAMAGRH